MHVHPDERNRDVKGYEEERKVSVEEENEEDSHNEIDDVQDFHTLVSRFPFPHVPVALPPLPILSPPPPILSPHPPPPVSDGIEIIDVDVLDK